MKKLIALLLALVLCMALCACGGNTEELPNEGVENNESVTEGAENDVLDKNDSSNYIGEWETAHYRLVITKGGVGRYEAINTTEYYDLNWEIKDEVLVTQISFFGMEHKAVLELNEDGTVLNVIQMGFPVYVEGEDAFTKK